MKKLMIVLAMMFFTVSFTACQDEATDVTPTTVEVDDVETPDHDEDDGGNSVDGGD